MKRDERLTLIAELVSQNEIATQEKLQEMLEQRGVSITQATLSRDMRELNIIKKRGREKSFYAFFQSALLGQRSSLALHFAHFVVRADSAGVLVVAHTHLGEADLLANALDAEQRPNILGTVAGADTLLIICRSENAAQALVVEISNAL